MTFAIYPSLAGRNVFISGGATGIGADLVRAFARNHARVAFVDVQRAEGEAMAAAVKGKGGTALFLNCDVTDVVALQASIAEARAKLGPIAVLVNNAANDERHAVADVTADYWDHAQNVNLRHHFFAAQAVHPQMRELGFGSIINLSSIAWRGAAEMPAYATAKAGIIGLTKSLARELARRQVTVNAIAPLAATPMTQNIRDNEKLAAMTLARIPLGRWADPEEIAGSFVFMASDAAAYITGQVLPVDGGTVM